MFRKHDEFGEDQREYAVEPDDYQNADSDVEPGLRDLLY